MTHKVKIWWLKKMKSQGFIILKINENSFAIILPYCGTSWALQEGFKLWILVGWWNISKNKNGRQEVTYSAMNHRKTLKILWVNAKIREKGFYGRSKNILAIINATSTTFTSALSRTSSCKNTTQIIIATQTFDIDWNTSISCINITKTNFT